MRARSALVVLAVVLTGCSGATAPAAGPTVTVDGVTVPVTDTGIWALDETAAVGLLAIGVVPTHVERSEYEGDDQMIDVERALLTGAGVESVAPRRPELIAAARPRLIIGSSGLADDRVAELGRIAPVLLYDSNGPWARQVAVLGTATGHVAEAAAVTARVDAVIADTARRIESSPLAGASVSVVSGCGGSGYCYYGQVRALGEILRVLGFTRPALQSAAVNRYGYELLSLEEIGSQTADVVISLTGSIALGAPSPLDDPLLDVSRSRIGEVDGAAWYGAGPLTVLWILHDVRAVVLGDGVPATAADAPALWATLTGS